MINAGFGGVAHRMTRFEQRGRHPGVFAQDDLGWKSADGQQVGRAVSTIGIGEKTGPQTQACFVLQLHHVALRGVILVPEMGFDGIGIGLGQLSAMPSGHMGLTANGLEEIFKGVLVGQDGILG